MVKCVGKIIFGIFMVIAFCCTAITAEDQTTQYPAVTKDELIGEWLLVKAATPRANFKNDDGSLQWIYVDEDNGKEASAKKFQTAYPGIESIDWRFIRVFHAGGTGEVRREIIINGRLGEIDYRNKIWRYTDKPVETEEFSWVYEGDSLQIKITNETILEASYYHKYGKDKTNKNLIYKLSWDNEYKKVLFIKDEGKYTKFNQ